MSENQYSDNPDLEQGTAKRFIRSYVNSAIYIERETSEIQPRRIISPISESPVEGKTPLSRRSSNKTITEKSRSATSTAYCSMERSSDTSNEPKSTTTTGKSEVPLKKGVKFNDQLKIEVEPLVTNRTSTTNIESTSRIQDKNETILNWLRKKDYERKQKANKIAQMTKQKEEERAKILEQERNNFRAWLAKKTKKEEKERLAKELAMEEEKLKAIQKERKKTENAVIYDLWLKNKEIQKLEKQLSQKHASTTSDEVKTKRAEECKSAYNKWLETSKLKQKPIPMSRGLESLSSIKLVKYINPIPWQPNIESKNKADSSQTIYKFGKQKRN